MRNALKVEGEVTEDGHMVVELPPETPRGRVVVTLELLSEQDLELTEEDLRGEGLTAEEIASSPEIGAWTEGQEEQSGAEYVETIRRASPRLMGDRRNSRHLHSRRPIAGLPGSNGLHEDDNRWAMRQTASFHLSHGIQLQDAMIASVAARLAVPLYTANLKHFQPLPSMDAKKPY